MKDFILRHKSNPNRRCYVNELEAGLINIKKIKSKNLSTNNSLYSGQYVRQMGFNLSNLASNSTEELAQAVENGLKSLLWEVGELNQEQIYKAISSFQQPYVTWQSLKRMLKYKTQNRFLDIENYLDSKSGTFVRGRNASLAIVRDVERK